MVDIEKLINEIYLRTPIWDQTSAMHHNRDLIIKLWEEVASTCAITSGTAKIKWKSLRDNFRAEYKKKGKGKSGDAGSNPADQESNWVWFKNLLFLKDQMLPRKMSTSLRPTTSMTTDTQLMENTQEDNNLDIIVHETEENEDADVTVTENAATISKNPRLVKRKRNATDNELINIEKKKIELIETHLSKSNNAKPEPDDDLKLFLMSLYKPLSNLSVERQMFIRIKMQELIYSEMFNKNQHGQISAPFVEKSTLMPNETQYINPSSVDSLCSYLSTSNSNDGDDLYYKQL